jgi:hypothetical protein
MLDAPSPYPTGPSGPLSPSFAPSIIAIRIRFGRKGTAPWQIGQASTAIFSCILVYPSSFKISHPCPVPLQLQAGSACAVHVSEQAYGPSFT